MTVKELYDWAVKNNCINSQISIQYMDGGGEYNGNTFEDGLEVATYD